MGQIKLLSDIGKVEYDMPTRVKLMIDIQELDKKEKDSYSTLTDIGKEEPTDIFLTGSSQGGADDRYRTIGDQQIQSPD